MEDIKIGGICPLTGWEIICVNPQDYNWHYTIRCAHYSFNLWVSGECFGRDDIINFKHIIRWLIFNKKIGTITEQSHFTNPTSFLITASKINQVISESFKPNTPKEKSDQLLILLNKIFPRYRGEILKKDLFNLSFFDSIEEFSIYLDYITKSEFISKNETSKIVAVNGRNSSEQSFYFNFNFKGIELISSLEQVGKNSKNCFIAMSFSEKPQIIEIKEAIKSAVNETKYHPIIINEKHIDSDQTINDAIIAEIKRAKFVIADFTEQKSGVYFEAGFALGLGLPVIYCCEEEDFKNNSHFDVNHYPHILYKTPEQLRRGLIDKIGAWID